MTKLASLTGSLIPRKGSAKPSAGRGASVRSVPLTGAQAQARRLEKVAPAAKDSVRASLRLDSERHMRLKLIALHQGRTQQSVLLEALDEFLSRQDETDMHRARRRPRPE